MRIINTLDMTYIVVLVFFAIAPFYIDRLPLSFWTPFDQYANIFIYMSMYVFQCICGVFTCGVCLCINIYVLFVLICLTFNYELLRERAGCIGLRPGNTEIKTYAQMAGVVKLHLKINR